MLQSDKVQSSEEGKRNLKRSYEEAKLTQESLAQKAKVAVDTVKRLLGTKLCPNGVERWAVINIAKELGLKPTDIVAPKDWYPQQQLPEEFEVEHKYMEQLYNIVVFENSRAYIFRRNSIR